MNHHYSGLFSELKLSCAQQNKLAGNRHTKEVFFSRVVVEFATFVTIKPPPYKNNMAGFCIGTHNMAIFS